METLTCGHENDWQGLVSGCTRPGRGSMCRSCAHEHALYDVTCFDHVGAYLDSTGEWVTSFDGGTLMRVVDRRVNRRRRTPTGGYYDVHYVRAVDMWGIMWYGRGQGEGMCIHMHRVLNQPIPPWGVAVKRTKALRVAERIMQS